MRRVLRFEASDVLPETPRLLNRAGLPEDRDPPERIRRLLDDAVDAFVEQAVPVGLVEEIALEEFPAVLEGAGLNAPESALDRILPRAERLALFASTVGEAVSTRIRALFDARELPLGFLLDAVASEAADRLAHVAAAAWLGDLRAEGRAGVSTRVLPYSPGYCGWHVTGQRALFVRLKPEEIGIALNASCLMTPIKSVSGVLVAGPAEIHRFDPDFPFCDDCATRECRERIRSARESAWTS